MKLIYKLLYEFANTCVLSRSEIRNKATTSDLVVLEVLDQNILFSLPPFMIKHMDNIHRLNTRALDLCAC